MSESAQDPVAIIVPSTTERWVYSVESRKTKGKNYRVDLLGMGGASQCACSNWNFTVSENITKGLPWGSKWGKKDSTTCFHTFEVRRRFLNEFLRRLANKEDNPRAY